MTGRHHSSFANSLALHVVLVIAMISATFVVNSFGILSRFLIDDLNLSRAQVGGLVSAFSIVAAFASPPVGRLVDRIGDKSGAAWLFSLSAIGMAAMAIASTYALLLAGAALSGLAQSLANPATNKFIARYIETGRRGLTVGIKESGVQVGIFLGGLLLPLGALTIGWRLTVALSAILPLAALVVSRLLLDPTASSEEGPSPEGSARRAFTGVSWLAAFSFLMGVGAGAILTYLPLYAQEVVGMTVSQAGGVVALTGLIAIGGRIGWALLSDRVVHFAVPLMAVALVASAAATLIQGASALGASLLWLGAILAGSSSASFSSITMLAVIEGAESAEHGHASGIVLMGFLLGLAAGPPAFGYSVDVTNSYTLGWWAVLVSFAGAALVARGWFRSVRKA